MGSKSIILYTAQNPQKYVNARGTALWECGGGKWSYVDMARYLGWNHWVWALSDMKDFNNAWMRLEQMAQGDLWILTVPQGEIKWCRLAAQCENRGPITSWFSRNPESIREKGDIPLGLVRVPIIPIWITKKTPAKQAFLEAGLWQDEKA